MGRVLDVPRCNIKRYKNRRVGTIPLAYRHDSRDVVNNEKISRSQPESLTVPPARWDNAANTYMKENEYRRKFIDALCKLLNYATSDISASIRYRCIVQFGGIYSTYPTTKDKLDKFDAGVVLEQLEKPDNLRAPYVAAAKRNGDGDDDSHATHDANIYIGSKSSP